MTVYIWVKMIWIVKNAREILGKNFSIGISCNNSIELAKKAKIDGADYVAFGPAFNSKTKKTSREVLNLEKLKKKHRYSFYNYWRN